MVSSDFSSEDYDDFCDTPQTFNPQEFEDMDFDSGISDISHDHPPGPEDVPTKESQISPLDDPDQPIWSDQDFRKLLEIGVSSPSIRDVEQQPFMDMDFTTGTTLDELDSFMSQLSELLSPKETSYPSPFPKPELFKQRPSKETYPIEGSTQLSTEEIVRVAAARFVQSSAHTQGDPSMLVDDPLTHEDNRSVYLASLLLSAAEKINLRQYDRAKNLLGQCETSSSIYGSPLQRVVHYFTEALYERINRDTGRLSSKPPDTAAQSVIKAMLSAQPVQLVIQERLPFLQLMQFTSIQTIIDNVASSKRIHMVDLSIRHGFQWIILMQSLATRSESPVEYLKISAVGTAEDVITTTGKSLVSFAQSLNLLFVFKPVIVSDLKCLREDMFVVDEGEAVGVYSSMDMNPMIAKPEALDNVMRVIRRLKPCIMTVVDIEAKHNSPSFINRFTEALFFYSAYFDCLNGFMERGDGIRLMIEKTFHSQGIKNIVVAEGSERVVRHVGVSMWRTYFARLRLVEAELNEWSLFQASLLVKQFDRGNSCTLDKNGKALIIGWQGTPIVFVSAWKFR